ncbi:MAG: hypothetical protein MJH10_13030 [Epibacterium sp.]|nr:hypothetical protein [Epibacterium sp.]NQX74466.1 hypothetical protein [Epibacterium sp.]
MSDSTLDQNNANSAPDFDEMLDTALDGASEEDGSIETPTEEALPEVEDTLEEDAAPLSTTDSSDGQEAAQEEEPEPSTPDVETAPAVDYEARYKELQGEFTRRSQQLKEQEKRLAELEQKTQAPQVEPWDPSHPANARFENARQNYEVFKEQMGKAATDEQKQMVADLWSDKFDKDDIQVMRDYEAHIQRQQQQMFTNPQAYFAEQREQMLQAAREEIRVQMQQQSEQARYEAYFAQPDVSPIISRHRDIVADYIQRGGKAETIVEKLREIEGKNTQAIAQADRKAATAEAQQQLAKGKATITRDQKGAPVGDPMQAALKKLDAAGVERTGAAMWDALVAEQGGLE